MIQVGLGCMSESVLSWLEHSLHLEQLPMVRILSWQMMRCFSSSPKSVATSMATLQNIYQDTLVSPIKNGLMRWVDDAVHDFFFGIGGGMLETELMIKTCFSRFFSKSISSEVDQLGTSGDHVFIQLV